MLEQVQHLGLDRDIECPDRFVSHEEGGIDCQGLSSGDALAFASRLIGRKAPSEGRCETNLGEERADIGSARVYPARHTQRLVKRAANAVFWGSVWHRGPE